LPGIGKYFIGSALCNSENSVNLFTFCTFCDKLCLLQTSRRKNVEELNLENERGGQVMDPLFLSNDQEIPCPERHECDRRSEMVHHLIGKLLPQVHDAKQHSPS
jgi:hypothetical protein